MKLFKDKAAIATAWATKAATEGHLAGDRMFIEGDTLYSYGHHFILGRHCGPNRVELNYRKYSSTTGRQQSAVRLAATKAGLTVLDVQF